MRSIIILDRNGGIATDLNRVLDNNFFKIYLVKRQEEIDQILKYESVNIIALFYVFEKENQLINFIESYNYPFVFALIPINSIIYSKLKKINNVILFDIQKPSKEFNDELIDFIIDLGYSDNIYPKSNEKILKQLRKKLSLN